MPAIFSGYREIFLQERCQAMHAAIKAGRTALPSIGLQEMEDGRKRPLVHCPHCGSTFVVVG